VKGLFAEIRERAAEVTARARLVRIDEAALRALAGRLGGERPAPATWDATTHHCGSPASTLAFVVTLDAVNFGSGWFPKLRKRAGRSGYFTVAMGLKDRFDRSGAWSASELAEIAPADLAPVLGQDLGDPEVAELLALFVESLSDLGRFLLAHHAGRFEGLLEAAGGRAELLVRELARMPLYQDVARYGDASVPFYKRAQITAADLALAFERRGPGRFEDLDELTAFADNLVPHVLRVEGALRYAPSLERRIEAGELLEAGSPEEIEIRAAGLHGVERITEELRRSGAPATAREIDWRLWHRGQEPRFKAHPRHRARSAFY
jgi:hypothetical protein